MNEQEFARLFEALTGNPPLSWQRRLFRDHFAKNELSSCSVIDLPTGLGKTMLMAIWLIAWSCNRSLPRRLVYVVDRRTVVDQATDLAMTLMEKSRSVLSGVENLAVSTLRGQLADNREWSRDLSLPAIIIGTVDLIGSALLFSAYRSSYKRRPLEAGLLGQDSLLVLDEAHLSKPFEKLVCAIGEGGSFQKGDDRIHSKPMRVIRMSATSGQFSGEKPPFVLQCDDSGKLTGDDARDTIIGDRFCAKKRLKVITLGEKENLNKRLADEAIHLAEAVVGKRIVVFVRSPDDARNIADRIRSHAKPSKSKSNPDPKGPYAGSVEVLSGTMRGLERDDLVEGAVFKDRWLRGDLDPSDTTNQQPVFLVSTSAGEVGFDLNADHLVGDAAPLDSWIQRLGRVNRRGKGNATVVLLKEALPADKTDFDTACIAASGLLTDGMDVSPKALAAFMKTLTREQIDSACSPKPATVEVTDILLDAWSMTTITEPMPGRAEVGPWLRGIEKEQAQTSIAWRAELELFSRHQNPGRALKAVFAKHRVRAHECLTTYSYRVVEFLKETVKPKGGRPDLKDTAVAVRLPRGGVLMRTIRQLTDDPGILYAEPTLILPATFGGLDKAGMLSADAIPATPRPTDPPLRSLDVADHPGYEQRKEATPRIRLLIHRTSEGNWVPESLPGGVSIPDRLVLEKSYGSSTALFDDLRKSDLRIRLRQPVDFDDEDETTMSLVMLAPVVDKAKPEDQSLADHVGAVEREAQGIAERLELKNPFRDALLFAARWHDEGKKSAIWQRFVYGPDKSGAFKGKSAKTRDPKSLRGYRHELGSLLRIHHPHRDGTDCTLPTDADTRDVALHLIATHHGFGRPHFENPTDQDFQTKRCDAAHADSVRRFARLQRKLGWWHLAWLENLLRCADALASADPDGEDDPDGSTDDEGGAK